MNPGSAQEHGIAAIVHDLKSEFLQFINTRLLMLKAELTDKLDLWKTVLPLLAGAIAFLAGGFAAITFALIALIHAALLPNPYGWAIGGLIVGIVYVILGWAGWSRGRRIFRPENIVPERTLKVLKQDQDWLEKEVA